MEHVKYDIIRRVFDPTLVNLRPRKSKRLAEVDSMLHIQVSASQERCDVENVDLVDIRRDNISEFEKEMPELGQGSSAHGKCREGRLGNEQSQFRTSQYSRKNDGKPAERRDILLIIYRYDNIRTTRPFGYEHEHVL